MSIFDRAFMGGQILCWFDYRRSKSAARSSRNGLIEARRSSVRQLADAVAQRRLHCGTGLQGTKHVNGGDRVPRQLRRDVCSDYSQPKDLDVKRLAGR